MIAGAIDGQPAVELLSGEEGSPVPLPLGVAGQGAGVGLQLVATALELRHIDG